MIDAGHSRRLRALSAKALALAFTFAPACALASCAAIAGLDAFSVSTEDASVPFEGGQSTGQSSESSYDAPSYATGSVDENPGSGDDVIEERPPEAGVPEAAMDAAPDAPECNASSCHGCCTAENLCAGGGLAKACGVGGAACQDCTKSGLGCSASGACGAEAPPPPEAGTCVATQCANLCVPYFVQCCKSDQSCGCSLFFPPGPCE